MVRNSMCSSEIFFVRFLMCSGAPANSISVISDKAFSFHLLLFYQKATLSRIQIQVQCILQKPMYPNRCVPYIKVTKYSSVKSCRHSIFLSVLVIGHSVCKE